MCQQHQIIHAILIPLTLLISFGCAMVPHVSENDKAPYYDSAYNDRNRAPASVTPPTTTSDDNLDPVHMRTQADYYFAMGESQSLEGNSEKAIESFKMVLVYDPESAMVRMRLAAEYVRQGLISEALEQAELSVKKDPKLVDAHLLLGGLYSSLKMYPKAIEEYNQVIALDADNTEAPLYVGAVYAEQKQYDKAISFFEKLIKNPEYGSPYLAHYYMGRVYSEQSTEASKKVVSEAAYKKAEKAFTKSLELRPDFTDSAMSLGQMYMKRNETDKAIKLYSNYQKSNGPNLKVAEQLSQIYLEEEKFDLAYEQLEIIEANSQDNLNAKVKMALILIEKKDYKRAVVKLDEVLVQAPDSDKIRFYLAAVYEEMHEPAKAATEFDKIPSMSSFYSEAVVHAAYLQKTMKQTDLAITTIKKGIENKKDVPQFYSLYASLLDEKGQYQEAADMLTGAIEKFPDNAQLHFFLGTMQDRLGQLDKTIATMKKVVELDPNHVQGLNYLAFTYADHNRDLKEAEELAHHALEMNPYDGYILDTMGWVLFKQGRTQDAIKYLESAYKKQPSESIIAEHLGDAYYKHQLTEKAKLMYKKAAEAESDEKKVREIKAKITAIEKQNADGIARQPASVSTSSVAAPAANEASP